MGRALGALTGAGFFVWIAGTRALDPREIGWLMRFDWPVHFFGWHFFRNEPWHWPPGVIESYYAPLGTSIGFTDSIPLVAFVLKPFSGLLPATFQYIGSWLFLCFALQGLFGAWLVSRWSVRTSIQVSGAVLFVLMPALLIRIGHPALCAHWILLWALVIATRENPNRRVRPLEWTAAGAVGGLLHPYLAVMTLALLAGVALSAPAASRARALGGAAAATLIGWWSAGLFSVSGAESMATEGLGHYSMNLLSLVTPSGWSQLLPELPTATSGQAFEGFQYFGAGGLILLLAAALLTLAKVRLAHQVRRPPGFGLPVALVAVAMAIFALSPRITAGSLVLLDLSGPWTGPLAVFRATGRFFWPLAYLLLAWALAAVMTRLPSRMALVVLLTAVTVQAIDLHAAHESRRRDARDPRFYAWDPPMSSAVWDRILPGYDHLVLYPPPQCGPSPIPYESAAYRAGLHGLTLNAGGVARPDERARLAYCHDLGEQVKAGAIDAQTLYVVLPAEMDAIRRAAQPPAVCGTVDQVPVCVSAASYQRWRDLALLH